MLKHSLDMELDENDIKLINILKENSRLSFSELANLLNLSRQTVKARIERLERDGIIRKYTIKLSPKFEGKSSVLMIISAEEPEKIKEIAEVTEINRIAGRKFLIRLNVTDLNKLASISELDFLEVHEIIPVLETEYIERPMSVDIPFKCDYCGKKIKDSPIIYKFRNKVYVLCCDTCLNGFKSIG
jgi:DNA-binding Lrp family transcriptional regulator